MKNTDCAPEHRCEQCECCRLSKGIVWMLLNDSYAARRFQALMTGESDPSLYRSMAVRS